MGARLIDQLISMFFSMCVLNLGDERSNLEKGAKYNRDSGCREGCGDRPWAVAQCGRHGFPRRTEPLPLCEKVINFPHPTPGLSGSKRRWLLPPSKRMVHVPRPAPAALSSKRKSCGPNAIEEKCRPAVRKKMIQVPRPTLVLFRWKRGWSLPIREKAICFPRPTPGLSGSKRRWSLPPVQEDVLLPASHPSNAMTEDGVLCPERATLTGCREVRIAGLGGRSKGLAALQASLRLGKNTVYVPCS